MNVHPDPTENLSRRRVGHFLVCPKSVQLDEKWGWTIFQWWALTWDFMVQRRMSLKLMQVTVLLCCTSKVHLSYIFYVL